MKKITEIQALVANFFDLRWSNLFEFDRLSQLKGAGVYFLAFSSRNLSNRMVRTTDVFYVGMSNAKAGVGSRLRQFKVGTQQCRYHSAAKRFYREYCGDRPYSRKVTGKSLFFVAQEVGVLELTDIKPVYLHLIYEPVKRLCEKKKISRLYVPIQSASRRILKLMGRDCDLDAVKQMLIEIKKSRHPDSKWGRL